MTLLEALLLAGLILIGTYFAVAWYIGYGHRAPAPETKLPPFAGCMCGGNPHTDECLFQHFLSYSGHAFLPFEVQDLLRTAYTEGLAAGRNSRETP